MLLLSKDRSSTVQWSDETLLEGDPRHWSAFQDDLYIEPFGNMSAHRISVPEEKLVTLKIKLAQADFPDEVGCTVEICL